MQDTQNKHSLRSYRVHISPELFRPSSAKSFYCFTRDVLAITFFSAALYYAIQYDQYVLAILISIINGNFFFALFVVGHDCGHESFSKSKTTNNIVGFFAHHFLLTPYWAWKKSHKKHHNYSGNINKDESIVPFSRNEAQEALGVSPNNVSSFRKVRAFNLFIFITGINFHLYTIYNPRTNASHFVPNRVFLRPSDDKWIYLGTAANIAWLGFLCTLAYVNFPLFLLGYLIPILLCYHLMGLVTLMQHHHSESSWYYDRDWDYVKGALNTFDYQYGRCNTLIRHWHHDIANYHVVHHLFSAIPHYNLKAATEELKQKGVLNSTPKKFSYSDYFKIIWHCNFVENKNDEDTRYSLKSFEEL